MPGLLSNPNLMYINYGKFLLFTLLVRFFIMVTNSLEKWLRKKKDLAWFSFIGYSLWSASSIISVTGEAEHPDTWMSKMLMSNQEVGGKIEGCLGQDTLPRIYGPVQFFRVRPTLSFFRQPSNQTTKEWTHCWINPLLRSDSSWLIPWLTLSNNWGLRLQTCEPLKVILYTDLNIFSSQFIMILTIIHEYVSFILFYLSSFQHVFCITCPIWFRKSYAL